MNSQKNGTTAPAARKRIIMRLLEKHDFVSVRQITEVCHTSEITVRRDLARLEKTGLLIRTHGGAQKRVAVEHLFAYNHKLNQHKNAKDYICSIAAKFIRPNDIIFVDSGSTMTFLPKYLSNINQITLITNNLPVASEAINFENIRLILIGGEVVHKRRAVYGHAAGEHVKQYHANKAFIGTDGISLTKGLTAYDDKEASQTLRMAENADSVILLCDSSKFEKNSYFRYAPLSLIDYIISDKGLDPGVRKEYEKQHIVVATDENDLI